MTRRPELSMIPKTMFTVTIFDIINLRRVAFSGLFPTSFPHNKDKTADSKLRNYRCRVFLGIQYFCFMKLNCTLRFFATSIKYNPEPHNIKYSNKQHILIYIDTIIYKLLSVLLSLGADDVTMGQPEDAKNWLLRPDMW